LKYIKGSDMNPEGKRPLGRYRLPCEKMLKVDLYGIEWDGEDWINLA
jgi:hypothetical protein